MAAHLDDMFSFCVEPGKVSASVEVRFIDNVKVKAVFIQHGHSCGSNVRHSGAAAPDVAHAGSDTPLL